MCLDFSTSLSKDKLKHLVFWVCWRLFKNKLRETYFASTIPGKDLRASREHYFALAPFIMYPKFYANVNANMWDNYVKIGN